LIPLAAQIAGWTNKLIWGDNKLILSSLKNGPLREEIEQQGGLKLIYSTVVICPARGGMVPLDHADSADEAKGVCDGMADCGPSSHRHGARGVLSRPV
jgi:hypothetical protein